MESFTQFNTTVSNNNFLYNNNIYKVNWEVTSKNRIVKKQCLFCKTCGNYINDELTYNNNMKCKC
jgi:hypothetical protein